MNTVAAPEHLAHAVIEWALPPHASTLEDAAVALLHTAGHDVWAMLSIVVRRMEGEAGPVDDFAARWEVCQALLQGWDPIAPALAFSPREGACQSCARGCTSRRVRTGRRQKCS